MNWAVRKMNDHAWAVCDDATGRIAETFHTHAEAWRHVDRLNNEAVNRSQDLSDYIARKALDG